MSDQDVLRSTPVSQHQANEFMKGHHFRIADWGADQNGFTIEYKTIPFVDRYDGFFYVSGYDEKFRKVLEDTSMSQEHKDIFIRGTLNGILYAIGWLSCFDSFVRTE
jgi:hypothetical protein